MSTAANQAAPGLPSPAPAEPPVRAMDGRARNVSAIQRRSCFNQLETTLIIEARDGRGDARARLVRTFTPLIGSVARTYCHVPGVDRSELMQEGVVGVLRALERFNPELGTPFWAYASWWVRQAMQQLVSELSRPVVLSDRALRQLARVGAARRAFARTHGHEPSVSELATATGLPVQQLQKLVAAERCPRALEARADGAGG